MKNIPLTSKGYHLKLGNLLVLLFTSLRTDEVHSLYEYVRMEIVLIYLRTRNSLSLLYSNFRWGSMCTT